MTSRNKTSPLASPSRRGFVAGVGAAAVSTFFIPKARAGDAEITLKLATVAPSGTPWAKHTRRIKKRIKEESGGRVVIKPKFGGALGDEISTASMCKKGVRCQMWAGTTGGLSSLVPQLAALELPYLFPNLGDADEILDLHIRADIEHFLDKAGFKLLFFSENGERSCGSNWGPIRSPADLRGKKMRSQQGDIYLNTWRAMGASPVPMAVTEALHALQNGVVDGFDNSPLFTFAASWFQTISHFSLTRHSYQPGIVVMSKNAWKALPKDVQEIVMGDPQAESDWARKNVRALNPQLIANFGNANITVHTLSSAERNVFKKATAPTHKKFAAKYGGDMLKKIKKHL